MVDKHKLLAVPATVLLAKTNSVLCLYVVFRLLSIRFFFVPKDTKKYCKISVMEMILVLRKSAEYIN